VKKETPRIGAAGLGESDQAPPIPAHDITSQRNSEKPVELRRHCDRNISPRKWFIKRLVPQNGTGLIAGQWGTGKTTAGLDLAAAFAMDGTFAGLPIKRQGLTLYFALEGSDIIEPTLEALSVEKYDGRIIRLYWTDEPVRLLDPKGIDRVIHIAEQASVSAENEHGLPLVMIMFDTVMMAAGYNGEGAEQDNVIGANLFKAFARIAKTTGTLVVGLDHFGKDASRGTRGAQSKEDAADLVIALLGDRDRSGKVTNRRMVLRKLRGGAAGAEYPFDIKVVDIGLMRMATLIPAR
jgi:RecA-family ATPase